MTKDKIPSGLRTRPLHIRSDPFLQIRITTEVGNEARVALEELKRQGAKYETDFFVPEVDCCVTYGA